MSVNMDRDPMWDAVMPEAEVVARFITVEVVEQYLTDRGFQIVGHNDVGNYWSRRSSRNRVWVPKTTGRIYRDGRPDLYPVRILHSALDLAESDGMLVVDVLWEWALIQMTRLAR